VDYRSKPDSVQTALDSLICWSETWQLKLSVSKCGSLLLGSRSSFIDVNELFIGDDALNTFDVVRDLGVLVDCHLTVSAQIDNVISKAKQRIYLLFKSFKSRDVALLTFAFKTYILPILDYCSSVWNPYKLSDIDRLERVQRFYTKRLTGLWNISYSDRLLLCALTSLELRRLLADIILCFKIVHKFIDISFTEFFELDKNSITRGHNFKLRIPNCRMNCRKNFFSVRVIPAWNSLPHPLVNCKTVCQFKFGMRQVNLSKYLRRDFDVFNRV
jgi:hypothetical protein